MNSDPPERRYEVNLKTLTNGELGDPGPSEIQVYRQRGRDHDSRRLLAN